VRISTVLTLMAYNDYAAHLKNIPVNIVK